MANIHPKLAPPSPRQPFRDGQDWTEAGAAYLEQQRKESGNLPDSSDEEAARVKDSTPYRNLRDQ